MRCLAVRAQLVSTTLPVADDIVLDVDGTWSPSDGEVGPSGFREDSPPAALGRGGHAEP